jgi:hypothetical protein
VSTFRKPGFVPNLPTEEAAMLLNRPVKAVNLVVLKLQEKGAIRLLQRNPLQLQVIDANRATTPAERALVASLTSKGTLARDGVDRVLAALSDSMRPKVWRADVPATVNALQQRSTSAWQDFERVPPNQRQVVFQSSWDSLYLHDDFFTHVNTSFGPVDTSAPLR